jgi:glycosyltransferase involved in cell wall biosynthesis
MSKTSFWFWQRIVTPHMALLADALASQGNTVIYVANEQMSAERAKQGWKAPALGAAQLQLAPDEKAVKAIVQSAPPNSIHFCQGLRGNGLVATAQRYLRARGLRQWVIMETVDDAGWRGVFKRLIYRWLYWHRRHSMEGLLTIGADTAVWVVARGMPPAKVFPFAYFLHEPDMQELQSIWEVLPVKRSYRFIFVGNLIELKRVDRLIGAIAALNQPDVDLWVVGSGPDEAALQAQAAALLPGRVHWLGCKPMNEISALMAQADCLVLPSRHDGWGAVISEAMMVGTPVICSDACGASVVVRASGKGGVFSAGSDTGLLEQLRKAVDTGLWPLKNRHDMAQWAMALGVHAGARYLRSILDSSAGNTDRPLPPWEAV